MIEINITVKTFQNLFIVISVIMMASINEILLVHNSTTSVRNIKHIKMICGTYSKLLKLRNCSYIVI